MGSADLSRTTPVFIELIAGFVASAVVGLVLGFLFRGRADAQGALVAVSAGFYALTTVTSYLGGKLLVASTVVALADGLGVAAGMGLALYAFA